MAVKFSIRKDDLSKWIDILSKCFVFTGQFNEVFQCLRFTVVDGEFFLEAADNISYLKTKIDSYSASGDSIDCSFLIKEELMRRIVSFSNRERILFDINSSIVVTTESVYRLPKMDDDYYPVYKMPEEASFTSMGKSFEFLSVLDKMIPFVSKEIVRPELAGISISDYLYTSSDGYYGIVHLREDDSFGTMTLYPYFVKLLVSMDELTNLKFCKTDSDVWVKGSSFCYRCTLPVDEFPYQTVYKVLENKMDYKYSIKVDGVVLLEALDRVLALMDDRLSQVKLTLDKEFVNIYYRTSKSFSVAEESVGVSCSDIDEPVVVFTAINCIDSLKKLFGGLEGDLEFYVNSGREPIFIQHGKSDYTFFFMPMREIPV